MKDNFDQEDLDPGIEINLQTVKARSVRGVVTLVGRYFVLYGIAIVAQIFLSAYLSTTEYGIYGLVNVVISFLVYFSDIGLAASLIQKKEKLTDDDLKSTFTVQQILVIMLLVGLYLLTPSIQRFFNIPQEGLLLLYALGFSLFLSSLKSIPSVLLERQLEFGKIAFSNIAESILYYIVLVFAASRGMGIQSFTLAVLVRAISGFLILYALKPWRPGIKLSISSLKELLKFGIPYQINTFIALLKDEGPMLALGKILGLEGIGILKWSQNWVQVPLRVIMDPVTKVTFPAFARMQDQKEQLARSVTRSLFFVSLLVFPSVAGFVSLAPLIVRSVPEYEKWIPAMLPFAILSIQVLFSAVTTPLTNLFNAIGKIRITSGLMLMWTVLTWLFVPFLAIRFGVSGAAAGYAIVGASSVVALYLAKRYVNFSLSDAIIKPLLATAAMAFVLAIVQRFLAINLYSVGILIVVGAAVYIASILILVGASLIEDAKKAVKTFLSR